MQFSFIRIQKEQLMELIVKKEDSNDLEKQENRRKKTASEGVAIQTHKAYNQELKEIEKINKQIEKAVKKISKQKPIEEEVEKYQEVIKKSEASIRRTKKAKRYKNDAEDENIRNSSVIYSLENRRVIYLPSPVYTCVEGGRIVVDIEVNQGGDVIKTGVNRRLSTSANGCLVQNALTYAKVTKFNGARNKQKGTITFVYFAK